MDLTRIVGAQHGVNRKKTRFYGIGPLINDRNKQGAKEPHHGEMLWPHDYIRPERETDKLLNSAIVPDQVRAFLIDFFERLRAGNVKKLVDSWCPCDKFDRAPFTIHRALDAYTPHKDVLRLANMIVLSLNVKRSYNPKNYIKTLFGTNANLKIFQQHLKWLIVGNARFHIMRLCDILTLGEQKMNLDQVGWLKDVEDLSLRWTIFMQTLHSIIKHILEVLRRYFYITISGSYYDRLFYYRFDLWQKMEQKMIKSLTDQGILQPFSLTEDTTLCKEPGSISRYKFHLKLDSLRLICTNMHDHNATYNNFFSILKAILEFVLLRLKNYKKFNLNELLMGLKYMRNRSSELGGKVYIVKADIKNCFQSIKQELLLQIIMENLQRIMKNKTSIRILKLECQPKNPRPGYKPLTQWCVDRDLHNLKKRFDSAERFSAPIDLSSEDIETKYLRPNICQPVLRKSKSSRNAFRLLAGIRQGSPVSPIFSAIYIQTAFNHYLTDLIESEDCRLFCHVDDILFISTSHDKVRRFIHYLLRGFKDFNLEMNLDKMQCNFSHPGVGGRFSPTKQHVTFHRQQIDLDTLRCSYDNKCLSGCDIVDTFRVHPYINLATMESLLKNSIFSMIHLDEELNGRDHVAQNIYERALLVAHRTAVMILVSFKLRKHQNNQDGKLVVSCIELASKRVYKTIILGRKHNWIVNTLGYLEVKILVTAAFKVTWERRQVAFRKVERVTIDNLFNRYIMRYLVTKQDSDPRDFEAFARKLSKSDATLFFVREVRLLQKPY